MPRRPGAIPGAPGQRRGTALGVPAGVNPPTATIAPLGISDAASSAVSVVKVFPIGMVSTSLEVGWAPLEERADALLVVRAVIDTPPQRLDPLERLRVQRGRVIVPTAPSTDFCTRDMIFFPPSRPLGTRLLRQDSDRERRRLRMLPRLHHPRLPSRPSILAERQTGFQKICPISTGADRPNEGMKSPTFIGTVLRCPFLSRGKVRERSSPVVPCP